MSTHSDARIELAVHQRSTLPPILGMPGVSTNPHACAACCKGTKTQQPSLSAVHDQPPGQQRERCPRYQVSGSQASGPTLRYELRTGVPAMYMFLTQDRCPVWRSGVALGAAMLR